MSYPRFQQARAFKKYKKSDADLTLTQTTNWTGINAALADLTLAAQVGDVLQADMGFRSANTGTSVVFFDWLTVVSSTLTNLFSSEAAHGNAGAGNIPLMVPNATADTTKFSSGQYTVQAGDVVNGQVTVRPCFRFNGAGANATLYATSAAGIWFWSLRNLGPVDPH